ncbi:MAG: flagellar motor stator protein MotA [Acidobacteriia bacterium]|nr:flagellar motor stator protein MotA [Terriglobia bacterium]
MLALAGIVLVLAAVFGGYILESGNPYVLFQPAELLIVCGAACGIVLVANRPSVIKKMFQGAAGILRGPRRTRLSFLRSLQMLYEVFTYMQRAGAAAFEPHVEKPAESPIFSRYPELLKDGNTLRFLCDSLRMLVIGITTAQELDHLMDLDIEIQRRSRHEPVSALCAIADALPGLGIVSAVLGVVITMQSIGGAPEQVGEKVAAALVGTFLGIFLCYGVVGPVASRIESSGEADSQHLQVLRTATVAFARGATPILAIEYGRRSIPQEWRPEFDEMEIQVRREAVIPPIPPPRGRELYAEA